MNIDLSRVSTLIATTLYEHEGPTADGVTNDNSGCYVIKDKTTRYYDGGTFLTERVSMRENPNVRPFRGYGLQPVNAHEHLTTAQYDPKEIYGAFTMSSREIYSNMGKNAFKSLIVERRENLMDSIANFMGRALYNFGTEDGGLNLTGLRAFISDSGTGTVGGLDPTVHPGWTNTVWSLPDLGMPETADAIMDAIVFIKNDLARNNKDMPRYALMGKRLYSTMEIMFQALQRFSDPNMAKMGFKAIDHADVMFVKDDNCPDDRIFMVDEKWISYRPHRNRNWKTSMERRPINQSAVVRVMEWMGNYTLSLRNQNAVIITR